MEILENKKITAELIGSKTVILDIRAVTSDNTKVNIEVQLRNVGNMDRRSLFYWSREYSKGIEAGQDYKELPNVIAINIVDFEYIPINDFHTTFHLWEDNHKDYMLTNALEIHFVDMVKFRRLQGKDIKNDSLHRWLSFFDKDTPSEVLEEVFDMDTAIMRANEKITFLASDKETMRFYEMREMALSDYTSGINNAKRERDIEIAKSMSGDNVPVEFIVKHTGLDESTIRQLQNELNN